MDTVQKNDVFHLQEAARQPGASPTEAHLGRSLPSIDRLSYLWLVLAFILSLGSLNGSWDVPLAAWLYPMFLLRFVRTHHPGRGFLGACLVNVAAACIFYFQVNLPLNILIVAGVCMIAVFLTLPYLADRLLSSRLNGVASTLIFPLSFVVVDYLKMLLYPLGSAGSLAYTQYGNLPLLQLVSVTGISGIVFLITWFASLINWAWEQQWTWPKIRVGTLLYSSLLALVLFGGGIRLALFSPQAQTIRVAGVSVSRTVEVQAAKHAGNAAGAFLSGKATPTDQKALRAAYTLIDNDLLASSQREARAEAKIVLWPECGGSILAEDEPAFLAQGTAVAHTSGIYLEMGICVLGNQVPHIQDKTILLDPQGQIVWHYEKARPVPGLDPLTPGDGKVPTVESPYGRLSNVICFDGDFPALLRQAGQARADLMLVPSNDWREIDPWHTQNITFRAIENGFSLIRQTSHGLSLAVDYQGRVLASSDSFATDQQAIVASMPMKGVQTIYALVGDLFAWFCMAALLILMVFTFAWPRKHHTDLSL